ncbi:signal-induced proliferation-associated 1-like protein 1 isoform X1 [Mizuhopecten yessoensis]|uniref:Signal-induced proliferation-associated 1-like protein 2 n=1 Tax=Mizuhopecten yessoensis TaxID=6573 RepID=A0A210PPX7_MIZYE|nr:signal-induced proliferation-associated 1-like protein 1 isoform X1 [Mizuhopecten yessoensis]XP_021378157.1 signal-induced proliferation-associated 1-like protein 1 isoform X1 [Mizuhopecten yessoensis]XP_021378158.1 signal-induced proliferation-associated 1-like protein 1 isoform X1 [Mizuhopecten yessoensis]XP_021378160.1 signal-induced proliferation-associated 1-like protein 1 isoform X1 [Mizuhopecten yessoensis]XP_021378161.1 signal-induced proliferation-associated 1-like protein 1 isoform
MSQANSVSVDNVRHRSARAVEYYKQRVLPIYQDKRDHSPSSRQRHHYGSEDNLNGLNTSGEFKGGAGDKDRRVGFKDTGDVVPHNGERLLVRGGHRATFHGTQSGSSWNKGNSRSETSTRGNNSHSKSVPKPKQTPESSVMSSSVSSGSSSSKRFSRGLYRSNSNLEMDSIEYIDADDVHNRSIHRDYGSTSSLDIMGTSTSSDSFFAMLKDFKDVNIDQRSPAPAKLSELLRGGFDVKANSIRDRHFEKATNGSVPIDKVVGEDEVDSPRTKSKFKHKDRKSRAKSITAETRPQGLLNKLRGKTEVESGARTPENIDTDLRAEERLRCKAINHYDCQSLGFSIQDVVDKQHQALTAKNISTGASAASANRNSLAADKDAPDILEDTDDGDNKSNGLVLSCSFFRNETGGEEERTISLGKTTVSKTPSLNTSQSAISTIPSRSPACCGLSILDSAPTPTGLILPHVVLHRGHVIEGDDRGATYYRHFFYGYDHQNYFGIDENLGPVAVSLRREKLDDRENNLGKAEYGQYHYRIIFRTSQLTTLRGSILEDAIPSSGGRLNSSRGVPVKDILDFALPELQASCLKQSLSSQKTSDQLLRLDEQGVSKTYKIGVMYCRSGQSTEEEMYSNEHSGPAFEEFLNCIAQKVRLKGLEKYRAQLDNKTDSTGTHSYYATFSNCEIMFHVSTLLPYTASNKQQLLRKRHIGNDIVTIVFQEPGALPFTPKVVRSQFQHAFIIVRCHNPCTENVHYSVAVSRSKDVPPFGPHIPENAFFSKSQDFADFLLAKLINAEHAAHKSEKFLAMATRTRTEYLKDLALNHVTSNAPDTGSKLSKFGLGSGKKKEKSKQKVIPDMFSSGAISWSIVAEDFGQSTQVDGILGISDEVLVITEESSKLVIFTVHCGAIIGWTSQATSVKVFYNQGESVLFKPQSGEMEEISEICTRLSAVSQGCETLDMTLRRNGLGQLGFHIQTEGIVTDVEARGFAWEAGLRKGSRLVEICKISSATLIHEQMVDLLRTSVTVKVVVIHPLEDGTPRGVATLHTNCHYSSLTTLNAAMQANEHVQQRQKEALTNFSKSTEYIPKTGRETPTRKSANSDDFLFTFPDISPINLAGSLDHLHLRGEASKIISTVTEHNLLHQRELSRVSTSSSESYHLREMSLSTDAVAKEQRRESHISTSSNEQGPASPPVHIENTKLIYETQRGCLTLPLQKKSTQSRGDMRASPLKGLSPQYREFRQGISNLSATPAVLHHAFTEPILSKSSIDEGYGTSRHSSDLVSTRSDDIRHERTGSKDNGDYALIGASAKQWSSSTRQNQGLSRRWNESNSSGDSSNYGGSYIHLSDSSPSVTPGLNSSQGQGQSNATYQQPRKTSAPSDIDTAVAAVKHGNISLELLKQSQNTKYLLSQGPGGVSQPDRSTANSQSSSVNLSDTSFSSGSSHNSANALLNNRGQGQVSTDHTAAGYSKVSLEDTSRKRADSASTNNKGRPAGLLQGRHHSPLSSENSSPRSSRRNLSGMSSEESLNTRLRPGVTTKMIRTQATNNLEEELMRLIDPDITNTELRGVMLNAGVKPKTAKLKRTMSEESLHSVKGATLSSSLDNNLADVIFSSTTPSYKQDKARRLSPGSSSTLDSLTKTAVKPGPNVPLPDSTAGLEWSSLVNVATKAIEGTGTEGKGVKAKVSPTVDVKEEKTTKDPVKKSVLASTNCPTNYSTNTPVWRPVVANPQQRITELEGKVAQLEQDLNKERQENAALEAEVQELKHENVRLQEESQTAAAQLRKFTEWFFNTIDRQNP